MTKMTKTLNDDGSRESQPFGRREFVGGSLGAIAGLLFANRGSSSRDSLRLLDRLAAQSPVTRGATGPFNILVLGDSYAWQPGLVVPEKSFSLVRNHCATLLGSARTVAPIRVFARSGAVIGELSYSAEYLAKDAAAPWPGDVPDAFWDDPHPRGDFGYAAPSMWRQLQRAKDPSRQGFVDPQLVDLVLVSGGGNDVAITNIIAPRAGANHHAEFRKWIDTLCGDRMKRLLPAIATSFPNAKLVVTGYPQVISDDTEAWELAKYLGALGITATGLVTGGGGILPAVELLALATPIVKEASEQQSAAFADESSKVLQTAVDEVNAASRSTRAVFVDVRNYWGPKNAYAASHSFFWSFTAPSRPPDQTADARNEICKTHNHIGNTPLDIQCVHGAMGHPNLEGARAYAAAVVAALETFGTEWPRDAASVANAPPPPAAMRLTIREVTADAATNTIVVDAADARTGQPINDATVELYLAKGTTGAPFTYPYPGPAGCRMPNGKAATDVPGRPGAESGIATAGTLAICRGRVKKAGYIDAFFQPPTPPPPTMEVAVQVVNTSLVSKTIVVRATDSRTKQPIANAAVSVHGVSGEVGMAITYPIAPPKGCSQSPAAPTQAGSAASSSSPGSPLLSKEEIARMCTEGVVAKNGYAPVTFKP